MKTDRKISVGRSSMYEASNAMVIRNERSSHAVCGNFCECARHGGFCMGDSRLPAGSGFSRVLRFRKLDCRLPGCSNWHFVAGHPVKH